MEITEIIQGLNFGEKKIINTKTGRKMWVEEADPTPEFWDFWKENKEAVKESRLSIGKFDGKWNVSRWSDYREEDVPKIEIEKKEKFKEIITNIELKYTTEKLLPYQIEPTKRIINAISKYGYALDASDTGTGKTFVALASCLELGLKPIVICPKSVISSWKKVCEFFGITDFFVSNYEQYKFNNTEYVNIEKIEVEKKGKKKIEFKINWNVKDNEILIVDECHRVSDRKTINSKMICAAKDRQIKILGLSATAAENQLKMHTIGYVLELFSSLKYFWPWAIAHGCKEGRFCWEFDGSEEHLLDIHESIFPNKGSRISIRDLGDAFPDNLIIPEIYEMNNSEKIKKIYAEMRMQIIKLKEKIENDSGSNILTVLLRARQEIELLKIPTLVELAEDHIEEGLSVVIFVSFDESIKALAEKLKTDCIVWGKNKGDERDKNIEKFQSDKSRIIICNIKAGGVGISLHDLNGKYPRVSLISPSFSAIDIKQAIGRIHRAGSKSKAINKIVYCSGTVEERIATKLKKKIQNIDAINDGEIQEELF